MSFFDRLFGAPTPEPQARDDAPRGVRGDDERAVERYRYLLETAPPEAIEQVHAEAFAKLTPEQRRLVFAQLTENAPTTPSRSRSRPPDLSCGSLARWNARSPAQGSARCSGPRCSARSRAMSSARRS